MASFAQRLEGFDAPTVWAEFTPLANQHGAVNLGQGFPDWNPPAMAVQFAQAALAGPHNQYARSGGHPDLVRVLANRYSPLIGREINPLTEVTVSVGATEAIFAITQALLNPGDEVILFQPAFDIYPAQVQMAGGVAKFVKLSQPEHENGTWTVDLAEVEAAITEKTRLMILNTPHNPTGKVFTREELEGIADIVRRHPQLTVISDEVYESLVFDGKEHCRLASLPDMWERVLTVSSAGKTFTITGWKVGWVIGARGSFKPSCSLTNGSNSLSPPPFKKQWLTSSSRQTSLMRASLPTMPMSMTCT